MKLIKLYSFIVRKINKLKFKNYFNFVNSADYWEDRYRIGGNSGPGSYGRLSEFKAKIINNFLINNNVENAIEFGCGDGNQLSLINYKKYIGVDVSKKIIENCKERFGKDKSKLFFHTSDFDVFTKSELTLSMDVIFHLIEDDIFEKYMKVLFQCSDKFVIIYSSNYSDNSARADLHVRHRKFSDWIAVNQTEFKLREIVKNDFPDDGSSETSFSDFFIYSK